MKDKEFLLESIDHYALLTPACKIVFKTLIKLAVDEVVIINVKDLSNLSSISRPAIYSSLIVLEEQKLVERKNKPKGRLSTFILNPQKFQDIIKYYTVRKNFFT